MRFVCDVMLGKLAKYLRLLSLDATCVPSAGPPGSADADEETFFLTRRRSPTGYPRTIHVTSDRALEQLREIREFIRPWVDSEKTLSRCSECNVRLTPADKGEIEAFVPEYVFHHYSLFMVCPRCRRVYWEGSHVENMRRILQEVFA